MLMLQGGAEGSAAGTEIGLEFAAGTSTAQETVGQLHGSTSPRPQSIARPGSKEARTNPQRTIPEREHNSRREKEEGRKASFADGEGDGHIGPSLRIVVMARFACLALTGL